MKKRTIAQTPAPAKDKIKGSSINKKFSATKEGASTIELSERTIKVLQDKLKAFKEKHPNNTIVTLNDLKAVYRRGSGAYSTSHRPNITRAGWSYARVNKFLEKAGGNKVKEAYVQDDDLLKYMKGGKVLNKADKMGKQIICKNCGWKWNTDKSDEHNKYICHKCNFDNRTFYDSEPIGYANGGLIAPNGKPSNLNPEQYNLVRTPAFKKWFGDWENDPKNASKVVDKNGEPLVVYHGSPANFNIFEEKPKQIGRRKLSIKGHYFSISKWAARQYAGSDGYVKQYFLRIINFPKKTDNVVSDYSNIDDFLFDYGKTIIEKFNYDGAIDEIGDFIVFNSNQIKLADGTNTTFDSNNPDIRYKQGGKVKTYWYKGLFCD
jgi:hypothetical protein